MSNCLKGKLLVEYWITFTKSWRKLNFIQQCKIYWATCTPNFANSDGVTKHSQTLLHPLTHTHIYFYQLRQAHIHTFYNYLHTDKHTQINTYLTQFDILIEEI